MLKLSLKPGEYITLGDNIKIIFSGGSANNIHLLVDAPREINVARNSAGKDKKPSPYYKEKGISKRTYSYDMPTEEIAGEVTENIIAIILSLNEALAQKNINNTPQNTY